MGGGVMRTAAKVAGVGVVTGGLRGVPAVPVAEQSLRGPSRSVSPPLTSKATAGSEMRVIQRPAWEINDWEFAGVEEQVGEPLPRVVFSAVPNFQEAKEATMELKEALDKVYLSSPNSSETGDSSSVCIPEMETKSCLQSSQNSRASEHALHAFRLLNESPKIQNVVASIVSDSNVWKAISENPELKSYMGSYQTDGKEALSFSDSHFHEDSAKIEDVSNENPSGGFENGFINELKNLGNRVSVMVSNLQNYILNLFGFSASEDKPTDNDENSMDWNLVGSSIMGLAVLVVMVVIVKRV